VAQPFDTFPFSSERRSRRRYPLALAAEYRLLGDAGHHGSGRIRNISSGGVFIEVADRYPFSGWIELMVNWPCLLDGVCPLKLVLKGRVVRREDRGIAIESNEHEFRTAGPASGAKRQNLKLLFFHP
jgi:hypothetical protein